MSGFNLPGGNGAPPVPAAAARSSAEAVDTADDAGSREPSLLREDPTGTSHATEEAANVM